MSMFECIFVVVSCTFCNFKHIPVSDSFHKHLYAILGVYFVAFSNVSHPIGAESRFSKLRDNLDHKCMAVFCPECLRRGVEADSCWTGKTCLNRLHYLITPCSFSQYRPCATPPPPGHAKWDLQCTQSSLRLQQCMTRSVDEWRDWLGCKILFIY